MVGENKKEKKLIEEFYEWKKALKIMKLLLELENFEIKCNKKNCKIIINQAYLDDKSSLPFLICEADICGIHKINSIKLFFIPIEFSVNGYGVKNIYPVFRETELISMQNFLAKIDNHFRIGKDIYKLLNEEEKYIVFFLVNSRTPMKKYKISSSIRDCIFFDSAIIKQYVRNPPFMHILNPIFKGELVQKEEKENNNIRISNIINWNNEWKEINKTIQTFLEYIFNYINIEELKKINKFKRIYYSTFVDPYIRIYEEFKMKKAYDVNPTEITEILDIVYNQVSKKRRHRVPLDFLRTPVPFCFWDFIKKWNYVKNNLKKNGELRILWIDNNVSSEEEKHLKSILKELLASEEGKSIDINVKSVSNIEVNKLRDVLGNYKPHIILLDFFLDDEDVIVASWFIEDLFSEIKDKGINYWVMITSRYTPTVVKYLESGFLGGYYPNAFVYLGDFWKKDKNDFNIIFAYKFIDLLESKIKFIENIEEEIKKYIENNLKNKESEKKENENGNEDERVNNTISMENLLLKLRILLYEMDNISDIIQLKYSKDMYELLYSYIIYKSVLPETERDLIEELRRRILYKLKQSRN